MSEAAPGRPADVNGVAVVTGGGSGIGRATALRLLADGWAVVVADVNDDSAAGTVELAGQGPVAAVHADVAVEADVEAAVALAVERFGRLDCMVNNAGVAGAFGPITEVAVDDWDYTFAVLARGVFLGTKHAARCFAAAGRGGSVVNVASIGGVGGAIAQQAYSAAKAAVVNLTVTTAVELAQHRVRVNAVAPGPVLTPLAAGADDRLERLARTLTTTQPWPEPGRPEDVAAVIAFLAGPDAHFVTGETIVVDGGLTAAGGRAQIDRLGNPIARGLVGVNRGTTGRPTETRAVDVSPRRP